MKIAFLFALVSCLALSQAKSVNSDADGELLELLNDLIDLEERETSKHEQVKQTKTNDANVGDIKKMEDIDGKIDIRFAEVDDEAKEYREQEVGAILESLNSKRRQYPGWEAWSPYSSCSQTCGASVRTRTRVCPPSEDCEGSSTESHRCSVPACPGDNFEFEYYKHNANCIGQHIELVVIKETTQDCAKLCIKDFPRCKFFVYDEHHKYCTTRPDCKETFEYSGNHILQLKKSSDNCDINPCPENSIQGKDCRCYCPGDSYPIRECSKECRETPKGNFYLGTMNKTRTGKTCQRWDKQTPHGHSAFGGVDAIEKPTFSLFAWITTQEELHQNLVNAIGYSREEPTVHENYCRNPDNEPDGPWCYTTDPDTRYEFCHVPMCTECKTDRHGIEYRGFVAVTESGKTCQRWDTQTPHSHTRTMDPRQENFCRNPDYTSDGPWCYTTDPNTRWERCDVPRC